MADQPRIRVFAERLVRTVIEGLIAEGGPIGHHATALEHWLSEMPLARISDAIAKLLADDPPSAVAVPTELQVYHDFAMRYRLILEVFGDTYELRAYDEDRDDWLTIARAETPWAAMTQGCARLHGCTPLHVAHLELPDYNRDGSICRPGDEECRSD